MLAITVNGNPVDIPAVVERGRVLVPVRAVFTALGASVTYDPKTRTIEARTPQRTIVLSGIAGQTIDNRAYVPLRAVAEDLGASVRYDARAQNVAIAMPQAGAGQTVVTALQPAQDAAVDSAYPAISATLERATARTGDVTLTIDGADVTQLAAFDGTTITYLPRSGLARGSHSVVFSGKTSAQQPFSAQWSFTTNMAAPPDAPAFYAPDFRFYADGPGAFYSGDWMHFVLVAPPGGSAALRLCGYGDFPLTGSLQSELYSVSIPVPQGVWIPNCQVTATYTGWNGETTYVPMPVYIAMYTRPNPAATPNPHSTTRPIAPEPRKPETTPAPIATPHPAATLRPLPPHHEPLIPRPRRTPPA